MGGGKSIFSYNSSIFIPYKIDNWEDKEKYLGLSKNNENYKNYFVISSYVINVLLEFDKEGRRDKEKLANCVIIMERIKKTFDKHGKFPRDEYVSGKKRFPDGWVSSMDAPTIMVASRMLYELTGDKKWKNFIKDLTTYVIKNTEQEGFSFQIMETIWPLEYAMKGVTKDEALFVLNGSLTGYLGLCIISDLENNHDLKIYLEKVDNAYKKIFPKFPYKKYKWSRYMLHPSTVIPPHYMIFERELFYSIFRLTGKELYKKEYEYRMDCLENILAPQLKIDAKGGMDFIIRRASAPHPYKIDCYPTKVVFYDETRNAVKSFENNNKNGSDYDVPGFKSGEFLYGNVPLNVKTYAYFRNDTGEKLFEKNIEQSDFIKDTESMKKIKANLKTIFDAKFLTDRSVLLKRSLSDKQEGRVKYVLLKPDNIDEKAYYAIEVENCNAKEFNISVVLYDSDKNGASRYLMPLRPGKNLVLFNILGFANIDTLKNLNRIDLCIYTNRPESEGVLKLGNLLRFKNLFQLRDYRMYSAYEVCPQK